MSKKARTVAMAVAAVLAGVSLQAAPLPGFALKAQTEHFSFYSRDNAKVEADKAEKFLGEVQNLLGSRFSGKAEYYRYQNPQELAAGTGTYAAGITYPRSGQIHSTESFHAHEIVHLVAGQLGNPGTFFQEGLAVAIGNQAKWQGKDVHKLAKGLAKGVTVSTLVASFERMDTDTSYALAGSFVASLIKIHGVAKVADFFRACSSKTPTSQAFAATFGQTMDEAGASWLATL